MKRKRLTPPLLGGVLSSLTCYGLQTLKGGKNPIKTNCTEMLATESTRSHRCMTNKVKVTQSGRIFFPKAQSLKPALNLQALASQPYHSCTEMDSGSAACSQQLAALQHHRLPRAQGEYATRLQKKSCYYRNIQNSKLSERCERTTHVHLLPCLFFPSWFCRLGKSELAA